MKKIIIIAAFLLMFASVAAAQSPKFSGEWIWWRIPGQNEGLIVKLKERNGRVKGTANGFLPRMFEVEIASAKIVGNSFTAKISDDFGNSGTVKITVRGKNLYWHVLKSSVKETVTFPLNVDLKRRR